MSLQTRKFISATLAVMGLLTYKFAPDTALAYGAGFGLMAVAFILYLPVHRQKVREAGGVLLDPEAQRQEHRKDEKQWRALSRISTWYVEGRYSGADLGDLYLFAEVMSWTIGAVGTLLLPFMLWFAGLLGLVLVPLGPGLVWVGWLFGKARRMRYVPFRAMPEGYGNRDFPAATLPETRASGEFVLGDRRQHFVDLPVESAITEDGTVVLGVNVSFIEKFSGITTAKHEGTWTLSIPGWSLRALEPGLLYLYGITRPALRLKIVRSTGSGRKAKPEWVILSFPTTVAAAEVARSLQPLIQTQTGPA